MLAAINRLILIICATLCVTFLAVFMVRWAGSQQQFAEPPHAWFTLPEWKIQEVPVNEFCSSRKPFAVEPTSIALISVHNTAEGWSLKCPTFVPPKELFAKNPHPNWLVIVESHETTSLESLVEQMSAFDKTKNLGVFSPSQIVSRYLRKKAPQWVYAADAATMLRLHMFSSFWIETAFDFWPDFVMQSRGDKNSNLTERERAELLRRKKRIVEIAN